jgi:hypothetical protein
MDFRLGTAFAHPMGMNNGLSEKIAAIFVVGAGLITAVDGAILILSIPLILYIGLMSLAFMLSHNGNLLIGLGFFALLLARLGVYAFTVRLFLGYLRHAGGGLDRQSADRLWIKTIVWNAIFFFPSAYLNLCALLANESYLDCRPYDDGCSWLLNTLNEYSSIFIILTIWWGFATFAPFLAMASAEDTEPVLS